MPLTLEEYDHKVGHHLRMVRHHAASIETHVCYMTHQPGFEAMAEDALVHVVATLESALQLSRNALEHYRGKPRDA